MNFTSKPFTFDRVVRLLIGLTVLILLYLLVQRLSSVLLPFVVAWLLAYLLQPFVKFFQYKLKFKSRVLSILATLLLFFTSVAGLVMFLAPLVTSELEKIAQLNILNSKLLNVNTLMPLSWQNELSAYISGLDIQTILKDENIMASLKKIAPQIWSLVNGSLDFVLGLSVVVIVLLYLIFILLDFEDIASSWITIIPPQYRTMVMEITNDLESGMNRYFRGQALVALIVGVLFAIGFSIIQLPLAIVMGLLIGLLTMVPYLKAILLIPCVALGWLQSVEMGRPFGAVLLSIAVVFVLIQAFEDLFLTPHIMGRVTGLNPAVILLSLSVWGSLMGVVGMIIALPLTTLIISYYKRFVLKELVFNSVEDVEVEPLPNKDQIIDM